MSSPALLWLAGPVPFAILAYCVWKALRRAQTFAAHVVNSIGHAA